MAPLFGTHTKNTTVTKLRGCSVELQDSSKVGIRDTLVFLICLMCLLTCYDLSSFGEIIRREDKHLLLDTKYF